LQLYRKLQQENAELSSSLEISDEHSLQLEKDKESYMAKIIEDGELIAILNE
jgi:hypothetical protein